MLCNLCLAVLSRKRLPMKELLKKLISSATDTLYDESLTCDLCGKEVFFGENFCKDCLNNFLYIGEDFCQKCGRRTLNKCGMCNDCKNFEVDFARSIFEYGGSASKLIHKLKYRNAKYLARISAELMAKVIVENRIEVDIITFIPMTEKQEYIRGYNHTEVLAEKLGEITGIEVIGLLTKDFATQNQVGLSYEERRKNLKGSFKVIDKKLVKGKRILIIDDVLTTGATSNEIAHELKKAKAESVYLLTIASVTKKKNKTIELYKPYLREGLIYGSI